jgi:ABC-type glycerol-3-phosphate transport system substrate-binding protein
MNIKTFMALAVVALTAACSEQPVAEAPTAADNTVVSEAPEPDTLGENEQPQ